MLLETGVFMTSHSLENSIHTLKKVRDAYSSQLDTSILKELNEVITDLEKLENEKEQKNGGERRFRALQVLGIVIRIVSDIDQWMK